MLFILSCAVSVLQQYEISDDASGDGLHTLSFVIPRDANDGIINNRREIYKFG